MTTASPRLLLVVFQILSAILGGLVGTWGAANGVMAGIKANTVGFASAGEAAWDWSLTGLPLLGGGVLLVVVPLVLQVIWPRLAPGKPLPEGLATNVQEAIAAMSAWASDRSNPKRAYAVLLELQDIQFDVTGAFAPPERMERIRTLQTELSTEWHAALGPPALQAELPRVAGPRR